MSIEESKFEVIQPRWLLLSPYGDFPHARGVQRVDAIAAENLVRRFNSVLGRFGRYFSGVPFYVGHPDVPGMEREHADRKAYGWVMELEARRDGIYGLPKWSKAARELVENAHYKFLSVFWEAEAIGMEGGQKVFRPTNLISVGLTNNPNLPVLPLANEGEIPNDKRTKNKQETRFLGEVVLMGNGEGEGGEVISDRCAVIRKEGEGGDDEVSLLTSAATSEREGGGVMSDRCAVIRKEGEEEDDEVSLLTSAATSEREGGGVISNGSGVIREGGEGKVSLLTSAATSEREGGGGRVSLLTSAATGNREGELSISNETKQKNLKQEKEYSMKKSENETATLGEILQALGLREGAGLEEVSARVKELANSASHRPEPEPEVRASIEERFAELENRLELMNERLATAVADGAIIKGRLLPNQRQSCIAELKQDFGRKSAELANGGKVMKVDPRVEEYMQRLQAQDERKGVVNRVQSLVKEKMENERLQYDEAWGRVKEENPGLFKEMEELPKPKI